MSRTGTKFIPGPKNCGQAPERKDQSQIELEALKVGFFIVDIGPPNRNIGLIFQLSARYGVMSSESHTKAMSVITIQLRIDVKHE